MIRQTLAITRVLAAALAVFATVPAAARLSDADAARLGADLTPVGAEKAGNKEGTIPAWTGGLTSAPSGWTAAQGYVDPFPDDKARFTITGQNAAQYQANLSPGTLAMLQKYPGFRMPVYETRRTAAYPQAVYDAVKAQSTKVELAGFGVANLGNTTVPFPVPASGLEAIWNHTLRHLGGGVDRNYSSFPVRANGDYYRIGVREYRIFNANLDQPQDNLLLGFLSYFTAPATLEGTVFLVHEPVDQVRQQRAAWIYNAGQRRVRRAPDLNYDNINDGTEGMRTTDQFDGYNGAPDRYDWKIVGKQEVYVPYNAYRLSNKKLKYKDDIIRKNSVNPDVMRYELHRVWVVEANLKASSKHVYGKRVFYLDEDSWTVLYEDAYDTRRQLWRVGIHPLIQFYDATVPWYRANIWHDLSNGGYLLSLLDNDIKAPWLFNQKAKWADFQPDALRRAGTK
jgi:hypothetical protein